MSDSLITGTTTTDTGTTASAADASATTAAAAAPDATAAVEQQTAATGTTEVKTGDAGTTEAKTEGDQAKPQGAPEKYEFKAEGFQPEVLTEFEGIARELNMPQESAQKLLDKMGPKIAQVQMENIQKVQAEWTQQAQTDKEFGGEKLQENLAVAKKALDTFGSPELRTLLNESGLGNHPELIRAFVRAGKAISEDKFVPAGSGKGPQGSTDLSARLYPNQAKN